ncbi:MAG: RNA methyltransferase [Chlorobi bacterium]|nr:RNA methyltransferase [Chlorobiota bacterium]
MDILKTLQDLSIEKKKLIIDHLKEFVTEDRFNRMIEVLKWRTYFITLVLEDIYQPQNASATVRTCDCLGIQTIHTIENRNRFEVSRGVTLGAEQWVDIHRHINESPSFVAKQLKENGYKVVATSPYATVSLNDFELTEPVALLFGTEKDGLTDEAFESADLTIKIPMYGFTTSYNISVSVAITLYQLVHQLHNSKLPWQLTPEQKTDLLLKWLVRDVSNSKLIIEKFLSKRK